MIMDILDNIDEFILEETKERGIVIENDGYIHGEFINPNDIPRSNYIQVEGDVTDIHTTITTNVADDFASKITSVQPMPEDSWENIEHMVGIPEITRGGKTTKKSKKKRKQSKHSRRINRKK